MVRYFLEAKFPHLPGISVVMEHLLFTRVLAENLCILNP
ncbi:unnamed protein product [Brassica oleracea var. botrytis]